VDMVWLKFGQAETPNAV